jgi:hypothetical protein
MRIGHSGHNGAAAKIDNARFVARQLFRIFIRADERNPVFLHRNRFGVRLALVDSVNVPVNEDEIDMFGGAQLLGGKEREELDTGETKMEWTHFHLTLSGSFDVISFCQFATLPYRGMGPAGFKSR